MSDMVRYQPTDFGTERLGDILVKSGYFKGASDQAQAIVKILAGAEMGFGPIASMRGVSLIEGQLGYSAQLIGAAIKKSGRYDFRVREWTEDKCRIEFFERGEVIGESSFSMKDAQTAGLTGKTNWKNYPKSMLFARALSQGARAHTPDVFSGAVYVPEELEQRIAEHTRVDIETGEVIESGEFVPIKDQAPDEDRDWVRSADDRVWRRWLDVLAEAQGVGLNPQQITLPVDRQVLIDYAVQVKDDTERRQREAEAIGRR